MLQGLSSLTILKVIEFKVLFQWESTSERSFKWTFTKEPSLPAETSRGFSCRYFLPTPLHLRTDSQCTFLGGTVVVTLPKTAKPSTNDICLLLDYIRCRFKNWFPASQHSETYFASWSMSHWFKYALAQNTRACERIKISHFDWFRKLFSTTMQSENFYAASD